MKTVRSLTLTLLALGLGATGLVHAQNLNMEGTDRAARFAESGKPTRGMTQASVEARFGTPSSRQAPVGNPPITRWDYPGFAVFFEYDRVIHAVSK